MIYVPLQFLCTIPVTKYRSKFKIARKIVKVEDIKMLKIEVRNYIALYNYYFTGGSPLYFAAKEGHQDVVQLLLQQDDIQINIQDTLGKYLFYISIQ